MKIVAQTGTTGWLFEATSDEISKMMGFSSEFARTYNKSAINPEFAPIRIGMSIRIDKAWDKLKAIESVPASLRKMDELAKSIALAVETHAPFIEQALTITEEK